MPAILHLELHIDRAVYPELHRMLSRIGDDASRSERVRQLASAALVYEAVRLQGIAALDEQSAAVLDSPDLPSVIEETLVRVASSSGVMPRSAGQDRGADRETGLGPDRGANSGAASPEAAMREAAAQEAAPREAPTQEALTPEALTPEALTPETEALQRAVAQAVRLLPVLSDVVEPQTLRGRTPSLAVGSGDEADVVQGPVQRRTRSDEGAASALVAQKPATRSRLKRMKEKGLFHNE